MAILPVSEFRIIYYHAIFSYIRTLSFVGEDISFLSFISQEDHYRKGGNTMMNQHMTNYQNSYSCPIAGKIRSTRVKIFIVECSSPDFDYARSFELFTMACLLTYHSSNTPKKRLRLMMICSKRMLWPRTRLHSMQYIIST